MAGDPRNLERWTRHGLMLDSVTFIGAIPPGEHLRVTQKGSKSQYTPYRPDMSAAELIELVSEQYREAGVEEFNVSDPSSVIVFGSDGIRFDFEYRNENHLARRGRAYLAIRADRLHVIVFDATKLHYFEAGLEDVESMVRTAIVR
jgi:chitinase